MLLSRWMRGLALVAHGALMLGLLVASGSRLAWLAAALLLLPLPGLWRGARYTYAWMSMLLVGYCAILLSNAYADSGARPLMFTLASLAAIEFAGVVLYVRFSDREKAWQRQQVPAMH